jgi:primosomal protein N' (replication factor Y) (superfamily II helicase)
VTQAEQLPFPGGAARPRRSRAAAKSATVGEPGAVVQVMIDSSVPHLDRVFDYAVPAALAESAVVGTRVRVRFAGRLTDAFVVGRLDRPEHAGELKGIERVIGVEPVLTAGTLPLVQEVAVRYAGTFSDVVRAAVPPRHARAEGVAVQVTEWAADPATVDTDRWAAYENGPALAARLSAPLTAGAAPTRAVWSAAPATSWAADAAALVRAVLAQPVGGVIVVAPDAADVDRVLAELADVRAAGAVATLTADQGPERRYREFVRVLRGGVRVVVGTRASVFAPLPDLRLVLVWDDGDDALLDPQAPYWDARDVAALRSHLSGCDLVVGAPARSVVTQQWCESGWARSVEPSRATVSGRGPVVRALTSDDAARDEAAAAARIPHRAWEAARSALRTGAVLVQVARRGYVPALACQACRESARCSCGGPLRLAGSGAVPQCTWCGALVAGWACPGCGGRRLRAVSVGAERTAEEIGRAFPDVPVVASHAGHLIDRVPDEPRVVVATPGAEPACDPGYRAVLILDARSQLQRPALDATEDAVRRWFAAARLAAPRARVIVTAENALPAVQALVRWDAPWLAARELAERTAAGLPPATRMAALVGAAGDIAEVAGALSIPHTLLGPVPDPVRGDEDRHRGLVVVDRQHGPELSRQLRAVTATRSARAKDRPVHVRIDPRDI